MKRGVLCVNSTLAGQSAIVKGEVAALHNWGFAATTQDRVLAHGLGRFSVVLRARLGGFDPRLFCKVVLLLLKGYRSLYLVTPLDLLAAAPLLKALFPKLRIVAWSWIARDVELHFRTLKSCDHIFCLTEGALEAMRSRGLGDRASLELWGADPTYYAHSAGRRFDVALLGITSRDVDLALKAIASGEFRVVTTHQAMVALRRRGSALPTSALVEEVTPASHRDVIELFIQSGVSWIPLRPDDAYPSGYTNLAESLLTGTPVVIASSSLLPSQVLSLPGVFLYRAGDVEDFVAKTREALAAVASSPEYRHAIRLAAAPVLDGRLLGSHINKLLR